MTKTQTNHMTELRTEMRQGQIRTDSKLDKLTESLNTMVVVTTEQNARAEEREIRYSGMFETQGREISEFKESFKGLEKQVIANTDLVKSTSVVTSGITKAWWIGITVIITIGVGLWVTN